MQRTRSGHLIAACNARMIGQRLGDVDQMLGLTVHLKKGGYFFPSRLGVYYNAELLNHPVFDELINPFADGHA